MLLTSSLTKSVSTRIREAVDLALKKRGISARKASIDVVGHDGLIRDIRAGRIPSADRLEVLFDYLGIEYYFGPPRSTSQPVVTGFSESAVKMIEPSIDGSPEALRMGYLPIPFGDADPKHKGAAPIAIARSWLADQSLQPDYLYFYQVPDNHMAPTLPKGALALINTRAGRTGHFIWAYVDGTKLGFARLAWPGDGQLMISTDDHAKPPIFKTAKQALSVRVLGKVIWLGHDVGATS